MENAQLGENTIVCEFGPKCQGPQIVAGNLNISKNFGRTLGEHGESLDKIWGIPEIWHSPMPPKSLQPGEITTLASLIMETVKNYHA